MIQLGPRFEGSKFSQSTKYIKFYGFAEKFITESIWEELGFGLSIMYF